MPGPPLPPVPPIRPGRATVSYAPPPAPRRRLSRWAWAGIGAGALVLILMLAGTVIVLTGHERQQPTADQTGPVSFEFPEERMDRRIAEMVARRSAAMLRGDEDAWLADIDQQRPAVRERERMRFRNLRQLRPTRFDLASSGVRSEFGLASLPTSTTAPPVARRAWVNALMQFESDVQPHFAAYNYQIAVSAEAVQIVDVLAPNAKTLADDTRKDGPTVRDAPWDTEPLRAARRGEVVVFASQKSRWDPARYIGTAVRASSFVRKLWGSRPAPKGFAVFLADDREFDRWFAYASEEPDTDHAGYVNCPDISEPSGLRKLIIPYKESLAGCRIVLRMSTVDDDHRAYTLMVHEMAHAIGPHLLRNFYHGDDAERLNAPTWAAEGFAEWVENIAGGPAETKAGMSLVRRNWSRYNPMTGDQDVPLPQNPRFFSSDDLRTSFNYELSAAFYHAAERVGGRQKAVDLYTEFSRRSQLLSDTHFIFDAQLEKAGVDPDRLWAAHRNLIR
ncbi:hypothetical protein [Plantactinospora endophytica]|nr:hypothetical protein [Plantactinospora endophytica]